jgi:hypothetical protein
MRKGRKRVDRKEGRKGRGGEGKGEKRTFEGADGVYEYDEFGDDELAVAFKVVGQVDPRDR